MINSTENTNTAEKRSLDCCREIINADGLFWLFHKALDYQSPDIQSQFSKLGNSQRASKGSQVIQLDGNSYVKVPGNSRIKFNGDFTVALFYRNINGSSNNPIFYWEGDNGKLMLLEEVDEALVLRISDGNSLVTAQIPALPRKSGVISITRTVNTLELSVTGSPETAKLLLPLSHRIELLPTQYLGYKEENGSEVYAVSGTCISGYIFASGKRISTYEQFLYEKYSKVPFNVDVYLPMQEQYGSILFDASLTGNHSEIVGYQSSLRIYDHLSLNTLDLYGYSTAEHVNSLGVSTVSVGGVETLIDTDSLIPKALYQDGKDATGTDIEFVGSAIWEVGITKFSCLSSNGNSYFDLPFNYSPVLVELVETVESELRLLFDFTDATDGVVFSCAEFIVSLDSGSLIITDGVNPLSFPVTDLHLIRVQRTIDSGSQLTRIYVDSAESYLEVVGNVESVSMFYSTSDSLSSTCLGLKLIKVVELLSSQFYDSLYPIKRANQIYTVSKLVVPVSDYSTSFTSGRTEFSEGRLFPHTTYKTPGVSGYSAVEIRNIQEDILVNASIFDPQQSFIKGVWEGLPVLDYYVDMNPYGVIGSFVAWFFNKANSTVWTHLDPRYIDSNNTYLWHVSELTTDYLWLAINPEYQFYVFSKSNYQKGALSDISDLLFLNTGTQINPSPVPLN